MHTSNVAEDRSVLFREGPASDHTLVYGIHPDQVCDVYLPTAETRPKRFPVLFLHGGYWRPEYDRAHARNAAGALAAAGWRTALAEYRRVPGDPDVSVGDVMNAVRCTSQAFDDSAVILIGHSAGGHLALLAAGQDHLPVRATVAIAPLSDLAMADNLSLDDGAVREFLGTVASNRTDLDPRQLPRPSSPVLILHGSNDTIVPYSMSEAFGVGLGVEVTKLPHVGHYEAIDPLSGTWPDVLAAVERHA